MQNILKVKWHEFGYTVKITVFIIKDFHFFLSETLDGNKKQIS